jgi:hypothetical protein
VTSQVGNIGEPGEPSPHDCVPSRRIPRAVQVPAETANCVRDEFSEGRRRESPSRGSGISRFRRSTSSGVNARVGFRYRVHRLSMVIQKMRQLRIQNVASRLTMRSAVRSFDCSARQPHRGQCPTRRRTRWRGRPA